MIKQCCNLTGWEANLAKPNTKYSQIRRSHHTSGRLLQSDANFHWWLSLCKVIVWFLPVILMIKESCNLTGQGPNWPRPNKTSSLSPIFPWLLSQNKKSKILIDSFQRYWWSKNTAIWIVESILSHNRRIRFFQDMQFSENQKQHCYAPFLG